MKNSKENLEQDYADILEFIEENEDKRRYTELIERYNQRKLYIYKIPLFSFVSSNQPYCFQDNQFDNFFNFSNNIFATVVDNNYVKEITTGMIFPIVDLSKNNDKFSSSIVKYDNLTEKDILFAISKNKILKTSKGSFEQLVTYLKYDKNIIGDFIKEFQESAKVKTKK